MNIRAAKAEEFARIMQIYRAAKAYMDATGNETQWESGYPSEEMIREDIEEGSLYVVEESGEAHAVFYFFNGADETYSKIDHGNWLNDEPYGVIHRVASDGALHGVMRVCAEFCLRTVKNLKIDTHEKNKTMQNALERIGFVRCGIVYLPNGDPRIAYQICR